MFNLNEHDINNWILQTHNNFIDARFGGLSMTSSDAENTVTVWYNNKAYHALPSYTSAMHNAILKSMVGGDDTFGISTFSHPLRLNGGQIDSGEL